MEKVMSFSIALTIAFLVGFSYAPVNFKNNADKRSKSYLLNINIVSKNSLNEKWKSIDRLRYVQGKIVSLKKISHGKSILRLAVEKNYHSGTDPIDGPDYPFKIGDIVAFFLNNQPKLDLGKIKRVIVYESDVTTKGNGGDRFLGASIKYYERNGRFFDMAGKPINLPPTLYPNAF